MTSAHPRRRARSARLLLAGLLLAVAAVVVVTAIAVQNAWLLSGAAVLAVALGAAATRTVHSELAQSRRDAAKDRADVARSYVQITESHNAENAEFISTMKSLMAQREAERQQLIAELEVELGQAQRHVAEAVRAKQAEARRASAAEAEQRVLKRSLDVAEDQAAEAVVRVAELEGELDALRAELQAWRSETSRVRKHA